jgi:prepilin-type N-terminal cleavage/methylation domain-containing protein
MPGAHARCAGVTLAELLVVMAVIAVLSGAAISLLSGGQAQTAAAEAAARVAADIAFAQSDAIARRAPRTLVFDEPHDSYVLNHDGATLVHPVTKRPYAVDLAGLFQGGRVDLRDVDFGGVDSLRFDAQGAPNAGGSLCVQAGGERLAVSVAAVTGRIVTRVRAITGP